jgi:hypothetical protein
MVGTEGARPETTLRLVGWQTVNNNEHIRVVRDLTVDEAAAYEGAVDQLNDHDRARALIEIVRRNLAAFEDTVTSLARRIPEPGRHAELKREAGVEVNRHFLNFLASIRQFLDHTELRLKRRYEDVPEVYEAFRARTAKAYDGNFAYRFLYKLRNYGQHGGAPIGYVDFETKHYGQLKQHILHLLFDAPQLLADWKDWGAVKRELEQKGGRFPVGSLPREAVNELEEVWGTVLSTEHPHLDRHAQTTLRIVNDVPKPYKTPAVIRNWHRSGQTIIEIINPPVDTMRWLGHDVFRGIF